MIDFNDVPNDSGKEFELIPAGTVARAVLTMKRGETVIPDYSSQPMFKVGATGAKYLECEFTIVHLVLIQMIHHQRQQVEGR